MLSKEQAIAASLLFQERPPTVPGSRAILSETDRDAWHSKVTETMKRIGVTDTDAFCNLAGVAD